MRTDVKNRCILKSYSFHDVVKCDTYSSFIYIYKFVFIDTVLFSFIQC